MCFKKVQGKRHLTLIFTCSLVPPDHLDFRDNPCAVLVVEQSARSRWREEKIQTNNMIFSSEGHVSRYTLCLQQFASISTFRAANHHPSIFFFLVLIFCFPPFFSFFLIFHLFCCFCLWRVAFVSDVSDHGAHTASEHQPSSCAASGGHGGLPGHQLLPGVHGPCPQHAPPLLGHACRVAWGQGQNCCHPLANGGAG